MLVSHRKKFIYIKTTKTAGTSIESYFEQYCMPENEWTFVDHRDEYISETGIIGQRGPHAKNKKWFNHMPAALIKTQLGDDLWDRYFKFCVIRNPFDKLISGFYFNLFISGTGLENPISQFRAWVRQGNYLSDYDKFMIEGEIAVDFFIKFEELEAGVKYVCDRIRVPYQIDKLPKLKSGIRPMNIKLSDYYDAETIDRVAEKNAITLQKFGYSLPAS